MLQALCGGVLTLEQARERYALSAEEIRAWERDLERHALWTAGDPGAGLSNDKGLVRRSARFAERAGRTEREARCGRLLLGYKNSAASIGKPQTSRAQEVYPQHQVGFSDIQIGYDDLGISKNKIAEFHFREPMKSRRYGGASYALHGHRTVAREYRFSDTERPCRNHSKYGTLRTRIDRGD